jgi:hypothetical protein
MGTREAERILRSTPSRRRVYVGIRKPDGMTAVSVNGEQLDRRQDLRPQAATAFDWGYAGSGAPAQLALAILADHWSDDQRARRHYERFVRAVICELPNEAWSMTGEQIDSALFEGGA